MGNKKTVLKYISYTIIIIGLIGMMFIGPATWLLGTVNFLANENRAVGPMIWQFTLQIIFVSFIIFVIGIIMKRQVKKMSDY